MRCMTCAGSGYSQGGLCGPCFGTGHLNGTRNLNPIGQKPTDDGSGALGLVALVIIGLLVWGALEFSKNTGDFLNVAESTWGESNALWWLGILLATIGSWFLARIITRKKRYRLSISIITLIVSFSGYVSATYSAVYSASTTITDSSSCSSIDDFGTQQLVLFGGADVRVREAPTLSSPIRATFPTGTLVMGTCIGRPLPVSTWSTSSSEWSCVCAFADDERIDGFVRNDLLRVPTNNQYMQNREGFVPDSAIKQDATRRMAN